MVGAIGEGRDCTGSQRGASLRSEGRGVRMGGCSPPDSWFHGHRRPLPKLAERLPPTSPAWGSARLPWRSPVEQALPAPAPSTFLPLQVLDVQQTDEGLSGGKLNSKWLLEPLGFIRSKCYQFLWPDMLNRSSDTVHGLGPLTSGP